MYRLRMIKIDWKTLAIKVGLFILIAGVAISVVFGYLKLVLYYAGVHPKTAMYLIFLPAGWKILDWFFATVNFVLHKIESRLDKKLIKLNEELLK